MATCRRRTLAGHRGPRPVSRGSRPRRCTEPWRSDQPRGGASCQRRVRARSRPHPSRTGVHYRGHTPRCRLQHPQRSTTPTSLSGRTSDSPRFCAPPAGAERADAHHRRDRSSHRAVSFLISFSRFVSPVSPDSKSSHFRSSRTDAGRFFRGRRYAIDRRYLPKWGTVKAMRPRSPE